MYSFAQRPDTAVMDEPLYGHYLSVTDAATYHPAAQNILKSMETNGENVVQDILQEKSHGILFLKHMTHHLLNLSDKLLSESKNILLTRQPAEAIHSFSKVIAHPSIKDLGYREQWELLQKIKALNADYWITERKRMLRNPEKELKKICAWAGIAFYEDMLHWQKGPKQYDGVWATHWYHNVHQSRGFIPYEEKKIELKGTLKSLEKECRIYYAKIMNDKNGQP